MLDMIFLGIVSLLSMLLIWTSYKYRNGDAFLVGILLWSIIMFGSGVALDSYFTSKFQDKIPVVTEPDTLVVTGYHLDVE